MISVIIPVYNRQAYIKEAVDSAMAQEEVSHVVVIDDASTDGTMNVLAELCRQYEQVTVIAHKKGSPQGPAYCRNMGLRLVDTPYVGFLDSDDVFGLERYSEALQVLENDEEIAGVYQAVYAYDHLLVSRLPKYDIVNPVCDEHGLWSSLVVSERGHISLLGLLVRTGVANSVRMDEQLQIGEDSDYILELASNYALYGIDSDEGKIFRRIHASNITGDRVAIVLNRMRFYHKWFYRSIIIKKEFQYTYILYRKYMHYSMLYENRTSLFKKLVFMLKSSASLDLIRRLSGWHGS